MYQTEESQIVRYVNTFTAADWESRKPNDRIKRGITRVTKSNSQSAEKFAVIKHKQIQQQIIHNENEDYSNRNVRKTIDHTSLQYLLQRIKNLELELTILQKQKIELARKLQENNHEKKPKQQLIQSHYITCKQDVEQMIDQKNRMLQTVRNLQDQNHFLKINMSIQQQYIIKVQSELDFLRNKDNEIVDQFAQTELLQVDSKPQDNKKMGVEVQIQSQFEQMNEYLYLKDLANQFENQTNQFALIIQHLEQEKIQLIQQNKKLISQISQANTNQHFSRQLSVKNEEKQKQSEQKLRLYEQSMKLKAKHYQERLLAQKRFSEEIIVNKNRQIQQIKQKNKALIYHQQNFIKEISQLKQSFNKTLNELQKQIQVIQTQKKRKDGQIQDLKHSIKRQLLRNNSLQNQLLKIRNQTNQNSQGILKKDYLRYRKQFNDLLAYLDQKNEVLKQRQSLLLHQIQRDQKFCINNDQTLKKQTEIANIIANYESQIKLIKSSLEDFISQLAIQRKIEKNQQSKDIYYKNQLEQKIKLQDQSAKLKIKHYQQRLRNESKLSQQLIKSKNRQIQQLKQLCINSSNNQERLKRQFALLNQSYHKNALELKKAQQYIQQINGQLHKKQIQLQDTRYLLKKQRIQLNSLQQQLMKIRSQQKQQIQQKEQDLQKEYSKYKQQFDDLLLYLDQKSEALKQKQLLIVHQLQNGQIIYQKNEQTLKKQTQIQTLISHYETRIKKIQSSLEDYISLLMTQRRLQKEGEISTLIQKQQIQKSINQRQKVYLLAKIQNLQKELYSLSTLQNQQLREKQIIINKLRQQIIELSKKYECQATFNNELKQQIYYLKSKLKEEELIKLQINNRIQQIKNEYNFQINQMQTNIFNLQTQLQHLQRNNEHIKQENQLRIIQVKKDYDLLYSKYIKYKTMSKLLQDSKPNKF